MMHESDRKGYLQQISGKPLTQEQIALMTGCPSEEVPRLLHELKDSGALSCTEHGVLYSSTVIKAEHKREACSKAGKRGGGNPHVHPADVEFNPPDSSVPKTNTFKGRDKGELKEGLKGGLGDNSCSISEVEPNGSTPSASLPAKHKRLSDLFISRFFAVESIPYLSKKGDFVQLNTLMEKAAGKDWPITEDRWNQALTNYFKSPLGAFTLAHFCVEFSTFFKHPLDRYGKPVLAEPEKPTAKIIPISQQINQSPGVCTTCWGQETVPNYVNGQLKGRIPCPKCVAKAKTA